MPKVRKHGFEGQSFFQCRLKTSVVVSLFYLLKSVEYLSSVQVTPSHFEEIKYGGRLPTDISFRSQLSAYFFYQNFEELSNV